MTTEQTGVDGGPAFPLEGERWADPLKPYLGTTTYDGMTLRDYFAAKAMQPNLLQHSHGGYKPAQIAKWAYELADAMLAARGAK